MFAGPKISRSEQQVSLDRVLDAITQLASGTDIVNLAKLELRLMHEFGVHNFAHIGVADAITSLLQLLEAYSELWQLLPDDQPDDQPDDHGPGPGHSDQSDSHTSPIFSAAPPASSSAAAAAAAAADMLQDLGINDLEEQLDQLLIDQADDYAELNARRAAKAAAMEADYVAAQERARIAQLGPCIPCFYHMGELSPAQKAREHKRRQQQQLLRQQREQHHEELKKVYTMTYEKAQSSISGCRGRDAQKRRKEAAESSFQHMVRRWEVTRDSEICAAAAAAAAYADSTLDSHGARQHVELVSGLLQSKFGLTDLSRRVQWPRTGSRLSKEPHVQEAVNDNLVECWDATALQTAVMWESTFLREKHDERRATGRWGEQLAALFLELYFGEEPDDSQRARVVWVNADDETGKPYDILLKYPDGMEEFVEVKTKSNIRGDTFFVSENELVAVEEYGDQYHFAFVWGCPGDHERPRNRDRARPEATERSGRLLMSPDPTYRVAQQSNATGILLAWCAGKLIENDVIRKLSCLQVPPATVEEDD